MILELVLRALSSFRSSVGEQHIRPDQDGIMQRIRLAVVGRVMALYSYGLMKF